MSIAEKLTTIAENTPKVYEAGKQSEYDRFWDNYQDNGKRTDYTSAFAGTGWKTETFRPKYDIVPITPTQILARGSFNGDIEAHLQSIGRKLDFSKSTSFTELTYNTNVTRLGVVDTRSSKSIHNIFAHSREALQTIDILILKDDGSQTINNNSFINCSGLQNIEIQGKLGQTVNFQWSPLSKASITSVINALLEDATGQSLTLSKSAVNTAFGINVDDETTFPEGSEYYILRHSKDNWTINYI